MSTEVERLVDLVVKDLGGAFFAHGEQCVISFCQDISPVVQKGPMCGLVGLTMAVQLLEANSSSHSTDQIHPERILEYAVQNGLSRKGEMFSAAFMAKIATDHLQLQSKVVRVESQALLDLLTGTISGSMAVLVPYDADKDHTPCLAQGCSAHWCLLVGLCIVTGKAHVPSKFLECCQKASSNSPHYVVGETGTREFTTLLERTFDSEGSLKESLDKNSIYVFSRHGKTSHLGLWSLKDLLNSNGNLVEVDPRRSNPQEYVIPQGGLEDGLKSKVVLVTK